MGPATLAREVADALTGAGLVDRCRRVQLIVNGEVHEVDDGLTVTGLLALLGPRGVQVAVEVNEAVVRRAQHAQHVLAAGDRVEIVTFVGGG